MISLGLYISKESFFIAEMSLSKQKPKLLHLEENFWLDLNSEEEKMAFLSQKIKERMQVYKGQSIRICCSLPQNFVSSFSLELPFKERFKILKTIPFEVEDHTPFQANKVLFDARVCKIKDNKSHILSFVTPEEAVQDYLQMLETVEYPIHLLSCSVASLANLLETWNRPLSQPQNTDSSKDTYLYLGIENSYLFFYKGGWLQHVSTLDWGCGGIVDEMQAHYKLSREKTWEEFFNKAFLLTQVKGFTKEQVFFSNLVKKHIELLIPKFNLLKMSLVAKKDFEISQVLLFGPGAMIKNLSGFLSDQLALSVYKSKYLTAFPEWNWREKPSALITVGLTLEGLKRHPYPGLNFLHFQKEASSLVSLGSVKNRVFASLLIFVLFFAYAFVKKYETGKILEKVQDVFQAYAQKIAYLPENNIKTNQVESFLKEQDKKREAEGYIQKELSQPSPLTALEKLVMKVGSAEDWDLKVRHLKISGLQVEIKGSLEASQLKEFQSLIQVLSQTKLGKTKNKDRAGKLNSKESAGDKDISGDVGEESNSAGSKNPLEETEGKKLSHAGSKNPLEKTEGKKLSRAGSENPLEKTEGKKLSRAGSENPLEETEGKKLSRAGSENPLEKTEGKKLSRAGSENPLEETEGKALENGEALAKKEGRVDFSFSFKLKPNL